MHDAAIVPRADSWFIGISSFLGLSLAGQFHFLVGRFSPGRAKNDPQ